MMRSLRIGLCVFGAALAAGCSTTDVWPLARSQSVAWNVDSKLPAVVRPPAGHVLLGHAVGRGVATFTLQPDPRRPEHFMWVVSDDEGGDLMDDGNRVIGRHSGRTWTLRNDGQVTAEPVGHIPLRGHLPWALLAATGHEGRGMLAQTEFVQQIHTVGGPPAQALRHADPGTSIRAEYSADYYFYGPVAAQTRVERGANFWW